MHPAELVGAFSYALDLTEGQPAGHSVRACWIGSQIGRALGLPPAELHDLYYALLLKDLGCSSNAARICELYLTDDRQFKHDYMSMDGSLPEGSRQRRGPGSSSRRRFHPSAAVTTKNSAMSVV